MAPKRGRGAQKNTAKKAKIEEVPKTETDLKLEKVIAALRNDEYPIEGGASNREMLILGAPCVFQEFIENRHANQSIMSGFIDEAFTGIRTHLTAACAEQQRIQDEADATRANLEATVTTSRTTLDERTAALEAAEEILKEKKGLWTEAKAALKEAKTASKSVESEIGAAEFELDKFTNGQTLFVKLRDHGPEKADLKTIKPILADLKLDGQNAKCFDMLGEGLATRGVFATITFETVAKIFTERIEWCANQITEIRNRSAEVLANTTSRDEAVQACLLVVETAENSLGDAKTARSEANTTLKEAEKAVTTHQKDVEASGERKCECETALLNFELIEGDLRWLKERTTPIPEPEIIEEEKPVEEVAPDVEMTDAPAVEEAPIAEETTATTEPVFEAPEPIMEEFIEEPMMAPMATM